MKTKTQFHKLTAWLLTLAMLMTFIPSFTLGVSAAEITPTTPTLTTDKYDINGDKTMDAVYEIKTAAELYWFAGLVNGTLDGVARNSSANAILTEDITVNSSVLNADGSVKSGNFIEWTPIGNSTYEFGGSFDGNNHTISGLYLDVYVSSSSYASKANKYAGLFGNANNAQVKNITIKDSFFGGYEWVGGIAGCFWGDSGYMENCVTYATIKGLQKTGGVAGGIQYADATNCHNHGLVMGSNMIGGFIGQTGFTSIFESCSNTGTVQWISGSRGHFAGFVANAASGTPTFRNCYNSGDVIYTSDTSYTDYVGGFACNANGTYTNCYFSGAMTVTDSDHTVGGFAASVYSNFSASNCYYNNDSGVTDATASGVTGKSSEAFASGEVCYLLNSSSSADTVVWKQTLTTDATPSFDGLIVYYDNTKYYNIVPEPELTLTSSEVTIKNLSESATLIVASYNGDKLIDCKYTTVTGNTTKALGTGGMGLTFSSGNEVKAFLWSNTTDLEPLCEGKSVTISATGPFDGEGS